jgi:hypothetical protein
MQIGSYKCFEKIKKRDGHIFRAHVRMLATYKSKRCHNLEYYGPYFGWRDKTKFLSNQYTEINQTSNKPWKKNAEQISKRDVYNLGWD